MRQSLKAVSLKDKLLKKVQVFGEIYSINYQNLLFENGELCFGTCCTKTKTITIEKNLDQDERQITFLHEFIHAIIHESGLNTTSLSSDVQEVICENIAKQLVKRFEILWKTY